MERDKKIPQNVERDKVPWNRLEKKAKDLPMCDKEISDDTGNDRSKRAKTAPEWIARAKTVLVLWAMQLSREGATP